MDIDIKVIENDVYRLLLKNNCKEVAEHTNIVANIARQMALKQGINEESAYVAGMLHDIGNIIPLEERIDFCNEVAIEVLDEERIAPALLHSKISKVIAKDIFGVEEDIYNAIECHSTLKANPGKLDLLLFVSDKISWENKYNENFIDAMMMGLDVSLECAAFAYLKYVKSQAKVMHPRTIEAFNYLNDQCNKIV